MKYFRSNLKWLKESHRKKREHLKPLPILLDEMELITDRCHHLVLISELSNMKDCFTKWTLHITCSTFSASVGSLALKACFLVAKFLTNQKEENCLKLLMRLRSMLREIAFIKQKRFNIYSSFRLFPIPSTLDVRNGIFQFLFQQKRIVKFLIYENIFFVT